jgi:uncharacterized protein YlxP (DUF503 family)
LGNVRKRKRRSKYFTFHALFHGRGICCYYGAQRLDGQMNTGVCTIRLHMPYNQSLKEKRRIVKSVIARLRNQFNISVSEVDDLDLWQLATLGISCVSNNSQHIDETLTKVIRFISQNYPESEIIEQKVEILHGI